VSVSATGVLYVLIKHGAALGNQGHEDARRNGIILFKGKPELVHVIIPRQVNSRSYLTICFWLLGLSTFALD